MSNYLLYGVTYGLERKLAEIMSKVKVAKDVHWSIAKNGDLADLKYIVIIC